MHFEQAKIDILDWISQFVEAPNAQLNGWSPCPYARHARLTGELDIRPGIIDPYTDLQSVVMGDKTVIAYVYDPEQFSAEEFVHQIQSVNRGFLIPKNIIALADHPDHKEEIRGVVMNQGTWAIAFVQQLNKLNHFARLIADKGYYEGWSEDYLKELFEFRQDPRQ
jgi:hypothetical protein